jgi:hypothetical protein
LVPLDVSSGPFFLQLCHFFPNEVLSESAMLSEEEEALFVAHSTAPVTFLLITVQPKEALYQQ